MKLLEGKLVLNEEQVKFIELDEQPKIKARKPMKEGVYSDCEKEIEQLERQIRFLKSKLKRASSEEDKDKISLDIEEKEERIGDLRGQQAEIRYIDNGSASNYDGYESLEEDKINSGEIKVYCYTKEPEVFKNRRDAIRKYKEGILCSEGSEKERYTNVLMDLLDGFNICWDGDVVLPKDVEREYDAQYMNESCNRKSRKPIKENNSNKYDFSYRGCEFVNQDGSNVYYKEGKETLYADYDEVDDYMFKAYEGDCEYAKTRNDEYAKKLSIYDWSSLDSDNEDDFNKYVANNEDRVMGFIYDLNQNTFDESLKEAKNEDKKSDKKEDKKSSKKDTEKKDKKEKKDEEDIDIEDEVDIDVEDKDLPDVDVDDMLSLDDIDIDVDEPIIDDEVEVIPDDIETSAKSMSISDVVRNEFDSIDALKGVIATLTLTNDDISEDDENVIDILNGVVDLKLETIGMLNKALEVVDGDAVASMLDGEERAEDIIDNEEEITIEDDIEDIFGGGQELEVSDKFDIERDDKEKGLFDLDDIDALPDEEEDSDIIIKDKK